MSTSPSSLPIDLTDLQHRLTADGYSRHTIHNYVSSVRQFLRYLEARHIALDAVDTSHVAAYLIRRLAQYRRTHRRSPPSMSLWRARCHGGVQYFLRATVSGWPRPPAPQDLQEALDRSALREYREWVGRTTDFASGTIDGLLYEAGRFLAWRRERTAETTEADLTLSDVDAYVQLRAVSLRRTTCKTLVKRLAHFLCFLHQSGRVAENLTARLVSPTVYQYESIPSALEPEQIAAVLSTARRDRSAKGRRDYAILMLLATYGLRAGEVTGLQLEDLNWREETLSIAHSKTRTQTNLPLMPDVAAAVFAYLRHGRPRAVTRTLFIRMKAPFQGLSGHHGIQALVAERLVRAGVHLRGKCGPHVFRHARAISLLRAHVPVKAIADILGHRSPRSTSAYLKLQSDDLRAVAMPVPNRGEARHEHVA
jgi:integrase/recombinase XerD